MKNPKRNILQNRIFESKGYEMTSLILIAVCEFWPDTEFFFSLWITSKSQINLDDHVKMFQ